MLNSSCNDLIGLAYCWGAAPSDGTGKTDCFQLACEIHKRLGFADYTSQFAWVYERYTEETFSKGLLVRWLLQNGTRLKQAEPGAVCLLPSAVGSALGTILEDGAMFISPGGAVIKAALPAGVGYFFRMHK